MFEDKIFIKKGLIESVGELPNYKIRNSASEWYRLGVFNSEDLAEIDNAINGQYAGAEETEND